MENTSGGGSTAPVPAEVDRWNWGAFLLTWIWGLGNNTFIALLAFVPFVNIAMPFVLGARGSAWAWRNRRWESVEAFRQTQRKWARWGLVFFALFFAALVGTLVAIFAVMKSSEAYRIAVQALNSDRDAIEMLGQPISTGIPGGSFSVSGPDGEARLSFSAEGPAGEGTVHVNATRSLGQWRIDEAVLENSETGERITLR